MIKLIVLEYKACSLSYFLDEMKGYELETLLDSLEYTYKNDWEQARLIAYVVAQTQSTKHLKPSDIISFGWDKEDLNNEDVMTKEDVDRLTKKMNDLLKEKNTEN